MILIIARHKLTPSPAFLFCASKIKKRGRAGVGAFFVLPIPPTPTLPPQAGGGRQINSLSRKRERNIYLMVGAERIELPTFAL